jgi:HK97 family phage major capsid protein
MPIMNYTTAPTSDVRASIAAALSSYYSELSDADSKPPPRFSLARVLEQMANEHGLHDGYERELCGATATLAGDSFDRHRVKIPLQALTRDLTVGTGSAGGFLVGTATSDRPFDVLRPWSVAIEAGVTVVPNLRENLGLPRVTGASEATWVSGEATEYNNSQPTLGVAAMTPKIGSVIVHFSRQWKLQAEGAEVLLRQQLLGAVGELLDKAFLAGSGASGAPRGLINTSGVNSATGTSLAHAGLLEMRDEILAAGGREDRLQWIGTPAVQKLLAARERMTNSGRFLWDDGLVLGRPAAATKNAPTATLIAGDFSQAVLGVWGPPAVQVEVNPYQSFLSGGMAARVVLAVDCAFPTPQAFSVASSVT